MRGNKRKEWEVGTTWPKGGAGGGWKRQKETLLMNCTACRQHSYGERVGGGGHKLG